MCGLVGIAGCLSSKDEVTMKRMFVLDYFRGQHATGLAAIGGNGENTIVKDTTDPIALFGSRAFDDALNGLKCKAFIGHNRYKTRGENTRFNAHPFEFDHIIGAHNGTLDQQSWNRLEKAVGREFNVDSQALIAGIAKLGAKEAISLCTTGSTSDTGAWSLVWYDTLEGSLNFLRNEHRPMWLAYEEGFKRLFWASNWPMIDAAVNLSEIGYTLYAEGEQKFRFFPTEVDIHYKFDVGVLMLGGENKPKPKASICKGREPVAAVTGAFPTKQHGSGCVGFHQPKLLEAPTKQSKTRSRGKTSASNVIHWLGTEVYPLGGYISEERFNEMVKQTDGRCYWCDQPVFFTDPGLTVYEKDSMVLCGPCSGNSAEEGSRIFVTSHAFDNLRGQ